MTNEKIRQLVDEGIALDRSIAKRTERLKEIKELLATEAESRAAASPRGAEAPNGLGGRSFWGFFESVGVFFGGCRAKFQRPG